MNTEERPNLRVMPFRPQSLPAKLRRLFDANVCSKEDFARASGVALVTIDRILRGATPSVLTRHAIDQVLAYYTRREARHLWLEDGSAQQPVAEEGLFEELDAAPGQVEIKVRDMAGGRMALLQFRADTVDDELCSDLERWHARKNPTHLTLAETSDRSS